MNVRLSDDQKIQVKDPDELYTIMQQILLRENKIRRSQEHFWVIGLNKQSTILFIELVSLGGTNRVEVTPKEVFRIAVYKLASSIVLVHNHPAGTMKPSEGDRILTDRMIKSGDILNVKVVDHLIISEEAYLSFAIEGIMDELIEDGAYEILSNEKQLLLEMKLRAERQLEKKEMAKKMKEKGYQFDEIKDITGLKEEEINKL